MKESVGEGALFTFTYLQYFFRPTLSERPSLSARSAFFSDIQISGYPTGPQNQEIGKFYAVQERGVKDLEAPN